MSDIQELFARDPLKLTKDDRSKIIAYFRENRAKFLAGAKLPKEPKVKGPAPQLSLEDLGDL